MRLVIYATIGAVIGWMVTLITDIHPKPGIVMSTVVGVVGGLTGAALVVFADMPDDASLTMGGLLFTVAGSVIALFVYRELRHGYRSHHPQR